MPIIKTYVPNIEFNTAQFKDESTGTKHQNLWTVIRPVYEKDGIIAKIQATRTEDGKRSPGFIDHHNHEKEGLHEVIAFLDGHAWGEYFEEFNPHPDLKSYDHTKILKTEDETLIINPHNKHGGYANAIVLSVKIPKTYKRTDVTNITPPIKNPEYKLTPKGTLINYSKEDEHLNIITGAVWDLDNILNLGIYPEKLVTKSCSSIRIFNELEIPERFPGKYVMIGHRN